VAAQVAAGRQRRCERGQLLLVRLRLCSPACQLLSAHRNHVQCYRLSYVCKTATQTSQQSLHTPGAALQATQRRPRQLWHGRGRVRAPASTSTSLPALGAPSSCTLRSSPSWCAKKHTRRLHARPSVQTCPAAHALDARRHPGDLDHQVTAQAQPPGECISIYQPAPTCMVESRTRLDQALRIGRWRRPAAGAGQALLQPRAGPAVICAGC